MSETQNINCNSKCIKVENKEWIEMTDNSKRSECEAEVKSDYENDIMREGDYGINMTNRDSNTLTENERLMIELIRSKKVVNVLRCVECKAEFESALDVKRHLDVCVMSGDIQCLKTKSDYSRDSFDRFGYDLCQELLSYLSFDESFAYECVSKTWKSLVFNRINRFDKGCDMNWLVRSFSDNDYLKLNSNMETITRKCVLLKHIRISCFISGNLVKLFDIIRTNCENIESISIEGYYTASQELMRLFGEKFGSTLKKISLVNVVNEGIVKSLLRLTPNLTELVINHLNDCLEENHKEFLPKLRVIDAKIDVNSNLKMFAELYSNRVEKMSLIIDHDFGIHPLIDNPKIDDLFTKILKFTKIETLCIQFVSSYIPNESLNMIAINCKQLTQLTLRGVHNCDEVMRNTRQQFTNLTRLTLDMLDSFDNNVLTLFPRLVDLKLRLNTKDDILNGIAVNAPQLKSVELHTGYYGIDINSTLQHLSRLENLISLTISSNHSIVTPNDLRKFIATKPGIRKLNILCEENSREEIIDAFIDLANRNPKRNYVLSTESYECEHTFITSDEELMTVLLESRGKSRYESAVDVSRLPNNLVYIPEEL